MTTRGSHGFVLVLSCLSMLSVGLAPRIAFAQDEPTLSKARARFQRALELEQAGNFTAALEQFRSVGQVRMTPQVRFHIASCEEHLGRLVTALGGYELALPDAERVGKDFLDEVDAAVRRLRASLPKLTIDRGSGAEVAEIELDGVTLGASSIGVQVPLDPGPHAIVAKAPGKRLFNRTLTLAENGQERVVIKLESEPTATSPASDSPRAALDARDRPMLLPYLLGGVGALGVIGSGVLFALRQSALGDLDAKMRFRS